MSKIIPETRKNLDRVSGDYIQVHVFSIKELRVVLSTFDDEAYKNFLSGLGKSLFIKEDYLSVYMDKEGYLKFIKRLKLKRW